MGCCSQRGLLSVIEEKRSRMRIRKAAWTFEVRTRDADAKNGQLRGESLSDSGKMRSLKSGNETHTGKTSRLREDC
jgi:hypothetical protein